MSIPLTFGVEFEFNIAALPDGVPDPDPNDRRPAHGLCGPLAWEVVQTDWNMSNYAEKDGHLIDLDTNAINALGRRLETASRTEDDTWDALISTVSATLRKAGLPAHAEVLDITKPNEQSLDPDYITERWEVTTDASVRGPRSNGREKGGWDTSYRYWPIELKSPVYYFCPEALAAIRLAIQTMTKYFRINVNESCGFHVHVGNEIRCFTFKTLQNFESFVWVFESQLSTLHPESRQNNKYFRSARTEAYLGTAYRERVTDKLEHMALAFEQIQPESELKYIRQPTVDDLSLIWETTDIVALQELMACPAGKMAYNIMNLLPIPSIIVGDRKKTVEFRQHEATFDADRVVTWIETVVALMIIARDADDFDLTKMLVEAAQEDGREGKISIKIVDLMRDLGINSPAAFYDGWLKGGAAEQAASWESELLGFAEKEKEIDNR